ncbi:hypothetical protein NsoK4_03915 [Nitrosopumilus sp. K4]|uniref:hypothetical protein n=1 Tax=Nitrosopumilus sp. K4 TaxID=2795383 RepID=UPI001BA6A59B|nr:hypothetical protein [Nitrosopumilus sp. K4]QUC65400.1 hypothetical protein NsoK4_03915 [Nitrosopumilus sp. K4]
MTIEQAKEMIRSKIESKENQIKLRKSQVDAGKFESMIEIIEFEIKNLQKDIEFLKSLKMELE